MKKRLTISIAAYNMEKWLRRCLDSFLIEEIMDDIEVLIINDGSTDGTEAIAEQYVSDYPQTFRLVNKSNGGHGSTINVGIKEATGEYFKVVDADDWVDRRGLIELLSILKRVEVDVAISPYNSVDAVSGEAITKEIVNNAHSVRLKHAVDVRKLDINFLFIHAITFRTELLKNNYMPIDENCFFVDMEYTVFYYSFVKSAVVTDIPVYNYYINNTEQSIDLYNALRRRDQHLSMLRHLILYYNKVKRNFSFPEAIRKTIYQVILSEYVLLIKINNERQSNKEVVAFDEELKNLASEEDYRDVITYGIKRNKSKVAAAILLLRKTEFHGYWLFHTAFHIKNRHSLYNTDAEER